MRRVGVLACVLDGLREEGVNVEEIENTIYVINATTGVRLFSVPLGSQDEKTWKPTSLKDNLWIATTTSLWGFQAEDGREIGHTKIDFTPGAGIATNGAYVYVPDANGWLQAVSIGADTHEQLYRRTDLDTETSKNNRIDATEKELADVERLSADRVAFNRWPAGLWTCEPVLGAGAWNRSKSLTPSAAKSSA